MIIYKSQIKIKSEDDKSSLNCELLTKMLYKKNDTGKSIQELSTSLIVEEKDGKNLVHDIEDYKDKSFYNILKQIETKHDNYTPSYNLQYIVDTFSKINALNYVNINKYSKIQSIKDLTCENGNVKVGVVSYEIDEELLIKDILGYDFNLADLYEDTLNQKLEKYCKSKLLRDKLSFLKSIQIERNYVDSNILTISRINGHKVFDINILPLDRTTIECKKIIGMNVAFVKSVTVIKNSKFCENDKGEKMVLIIDRDKYSLDFIKDFFGLNDCIFSFGKIVVGVADCENVKFLDEF